MSTTYRFAILTCSDRCSAGIATDQSGMLLKKLIENDNDHHQLGSSKDHLYKDKSYLIIEECVVPDNLDMIKDVLQNWCDHRNDIDCILTTGGTGFTDSDVTPEATKSILQKEAPGIVHALTAESLKITPMAMLSR